MQITLAQPRGFCAGAIRAIKIVINALDQYGAPVYVFHEIVHNRYVVENLKSKGSIFVESINDVPEGAILIFSAHGVSTQVVQESESKKLRVIDATCPLITEIHLRVAEFSRKGFEIVIIGHAGHPEIEGTLGRIDGPVHVLSSSAEVESLQVKRPDRLAYVTQTTLSYDDTLQIIKALKKRFRLNGPDLSNICYATQARQKSVRILSSNIDRLLVVGGRNSSNSNRLREIGEQCGVASYLIENEDDLAPSWFSPDLHIGITAGASAPEEMVYRVLERLKLWYPCSVREMPGAEIEPFILNRLKSERVYQENQANHRSAGKTINVIRSHT